MSKKSTSKAEAFEQFDDLLEWVRAEKVSSWEAVESGFCSAIEAFDAELALGERNNGWHQIKARVFNDLIVQVFENLCGRRMSVRTKKRSHVFDKIDVDICYPDEGALIFAGEVKALGSPPSRVNHHKARPASQDIHKRLREVAFTSIDLKAANSPNVPINSFQGWVDVASPAYVSFWCVRSNDARDHKKMGELLTGLREFSNGVGAFFYQPTTSPVTYQICSHPGLSIDRTMRVLAQRVANG